MIRINSSNRHHAAARLTERRPTRNGAVIGAAVAFMIAITGPALSATERDAVDCQQADDLDRSIAACTRIINDQSATGLASKTSQGVPLGVVIYGWRGFAYLSRNDFDRAIRDLSEAIRLDPRNVFALSSRAIAYHRKGDRDRAIADYRQADTVDAAKLGEMTATSAELKEIGAAAQRPSDVAHSAITGRALSTTQQDYDDCQQASDLNRSIAGCTRIINDPSESASKRIIMYLRRGFAYLAQDNIDRAIGDYNEVLKLDPRNIFALTSRAMAYYRKGNRDRAITDYRQANTVDAAKLGEMTATNAELKEIGAAAQAKRAPDQGPSVAPPVLPFILPAQRLRLPGGEEAHPQYRTEDNRDLNGDDLRTIKDTDLRNCLSACSNEQRCQAVSFDKWNRYCFLKSTMMSLRLDPRSISMIREGLSSPTVASSTIQMERYRGKGFPGAGYKTVANSQFDSCEMACKQDQMCVAFTFQKDERTCHLFQTTGEYSANTLALMSDEFCSAFLRFCCGGNGRQSIAR
jgi:tetratricopeptide (TPR) repeat protein